MTAERTVADIAARVGGTVEGDAARPITGLAAIEDAGPGDLTLALDDERARRLDDSGAAAALIPLDLTLSSSTVSLVRVENPRLALAAVAPWFVAEEVPQPGVASTADVHPDAVLGAGVSVGPCAVVGPGAVIGDDTHIGALAFIGGGATIGRSCRIGPCCSVDGSVSMGDRVRLLSGARLGTEGFGYTPGPAGLVKVPQIGRCIIGNDVDIGANSTVDRGTLGDTVIGAGTKVDNLVQIAHNVRIGRNCIIVGQAGMAGSVQLGEGVILGGQVGIADHVTIGDGARIGAKSGVFRDKPAGGAFLGSPALPQREALRLWSGLRRLHEIFQRIKNLETAVHGTGRGSDAAGGADE